MYFSKEKRHFTLAVLSVLLLFPGSNYAAVSAASFSCNYVWTLHSGGAPVSGLSGDPSIPCDLQLSAAPVTASPVPPSADGNSSVDLTPIASVSARAEGSISVSEIKAGAAYEVELSVLDAAVASLLGDVALPVNISSTGLATTSVSGQAFGEIKAVGFVDITITDGLHGNTLDLASSGAACTSSLDRCFADQPMTQLNYFNTFFLQPDDKLGVILLAVAFARGGSTVDTAGIAESSAEIDPFIWIDPEFTFDIDGETVFAADVFTLVGSDGIGGINEIGFVPLPPAALLFGSGLLGLVGIPRRKKAGQR